MTGAAAKPGPSSGGPLAGLKVIEMGMLFAGPLVGTNLSDLGAEVIKIEPPRGDEVRNSGMLKDGRPLWWRTTNRNKRVVAVDIKSPEGAEIVRDLVREADVLIENFRPGRVAEWGFGYEALSKINPGLVMLHISGYGQSGPYQHRPGLGTLAEAFSGFAFVTGEPDRPPTLPQFPLADPVAAAFGTYSVLAALWGRERNGGLGDEIDISLYEPLLAMLGPIVPYYDQLGVVSERMGNSIDWSVPRGTFRSSDGKWVAVAGAANAVAIRIFNAIDRPDMAADPGLQQARTRLTRADEVNSAVAEWVGRHSLDEVLERFDAHNVLAAPVQDIAQLFENPQVRHRGTLTEVPDEELGTVTMQNVVPRLTRSPGGIRWPARTRIGADTEVVLAELGYAPEDIARLAESGRIAGPLTREHEDG